ncbi:MAG TPA: SCO1664 family protein [Nocardioides sp.]|uniref:SCO1664 family protein n=1 Tax=Nocardioides sp. TaxID=35761 RepID=UPI002D80B9D3|nr:SCO1664 family protein [Nocardioides sp.]HET6651038.1 SCO1664 family protein [Nocardioides sp.]
MTEAAGPRADSPAQLLDGDVQVEGRVLPASNATFIARVGPVGATVACVYKPVAGERPLWDFPDGTLARREVAAYAVSEALGWGVVPPTVLRDGPAGVGMVQAWCEPDPAQAPVDLVPRRRVPDGYLHVLDAYDGADRPISLVHEDSVPLRRMAVLDVLVNNADRKGGHVLAMTDGHRYGVDHGVSFHVDDKLRTVLWGWAEDPLDPTDAVAVGGLLDRVSTGGDPLRAELDELLAGHEVDSLVARCERLLTRRRMPSPSGEWPAIPWPAF